MPDDAKFDEVIKFRVDKDMKLAFKALAERRGETEADLGRRIVAQAISQGAAEDGMDEIVSIVRQAMRDVLVPTEERLAALNAKTAIAAATSMYLNTQAIANAGQDAVTMYEESRKKAVKFVQAKQNS